MEDTALSADVKSSDDDWLFDSIRLYDDLHMYELQHPSAVLEWIDATSLCVACRLPDGRCEIQELALPAKLTDAANKALTKDRDFKLLSGGFHNRHLADLQQIPNLRQFVATEENENCVSVWSLGHSASGGLIQMKTTIHNPLPNTGPAVLALDQSDTGQGQTAAFASHMNDLCVADLHTCKLLHRPQATASRPSSPVSRLQYISTHCILTCVSHTGHLHITDTRTNTPLKEDNLFTHETLNRSKVLPYWTFECSALPEQKAQVFKLSSKGDLHVHDLRNVEEPVNKCRLIIGESNDSNHHLQLKHSHVQEKIISVSGLDGNVYVFNIEKLLSASTPAESSTNHLSPSFVHRGHQACSEESHDQVKIWSHDWHPTVPRLLMSTASDGSLHAWQYTVK